MKILKKNIKKGFRFYWNGAYQEDFRGIYEVVCFRKDLSEIYCYKPVGRRATVNVGGELAKFDERIINNPDFIKDSK